MKSPLNNPSRAALAVLGLAALLLVGAGLPHLFDPPIGVHAWRQAIATSMARLYAQGQPFEFPRAENCGAEPGLFMGSEFPLYAWLMGRFGPGAGIHVAGRAMGLLFELAWALSLFAIARYLLARWPEPARSVGAAAAGGFVVVSPLFGFYGVSFIPDAAAHGLALLGAALWTGPLLRDAREPAPLSPARFAAGALLIALGCMTKLIALPHLALAGLVLLDRARPREGLAGFKSPRPWALGALLLVVVAVPVWLWYVRWVPMLKTGGCDVVWLPETMDEYWFSATLGNADWRSRIWHWGALGTLGPLWFVCLAGVPVAARLCGRGAVFLVWLVGAFGSYLRLGWHAKQHDYDLMLLLPMAAVGFGLACAALTRLSDRMPARAVERVPAGWRGVVRFAALAVVLVVFFAVARPKVAERFRTNLDEVGLETALDNVLPEDEPIHYFGSIHDPKLAYLANRKARGTEPRFYCQRKRVAYDCVLATDTQGNLAPCNERGPAVAWPNRSLVCGIKHPRDPLAPPRVVARILESVEHKVDKQLPGVGRVLGLDLFGCGRSLDFVCVGDIERRTWFDLYLLADGPVDSFELLVDGKPVDYEPKSKDWIAGTVMVVRAAAPERWSRVEVRAGAERVELAVEPRR